MLVSTGKTLAYTLNMLLVGVLCLAVLACNMWLSKAMIGSIMKLRRNNVSTGVYVWDKGKRLNVVTDRHVCLTRCLSELSTCYQPVFFVGVELGMFWSVIIEALGGLAHLLPDWLNCSQAC